MCLTMPARVIVVNGPWAEIEIGGLRRTASTLPVPDVRPGDWALVAAGSLIRLLDPEIAKQIAAAVRIVTDDAPPSEGEDS
jgi:hydrogenase assembly chaperone HypC/HupF